jgi:hypothetical protein
VTWVVRSHPERDVEAASRQPESRGHVAPTTAMERVERVRHQEPEPEPEHCGHCQSWHDPATLCPEARWDAQVEAAYDLMAALGERGISLKLSGDRVQIHGGQVDAETLERLKAVKPALLVLLEGEA